MLLVDLATGRPRSVAGRVIDAASGSGPPKGGAEGGVEGELQRYMVEMQSSVCTDLGTVSSRRSRGTCGWWSGSARWPTRC